MEFLHAIQASDTAYRLGWALLHTLWLGAGVAVLFAIAMRLLRHRSANARYVAGCLALALMVAMPVLAFVHVSPPVRVVPGAVVHSAEVQIITPPVVELAPPATPIIATTSEIVPLREPLALQTSPAPTPVAQSVPDKPRTPLLARASQTLEPALPWVVLLWAVGVALLALWQLAGWIAAERLKRLAVQLVEPGLIEATARLARAMHVRAPVKVLQSVLVKAPAVLGWLRPVILLPVGLATGLTPAQVEAILAHELAHIRRYDYLVNLLQSLAETLLFYHPAVWFISGRIRAERENCCDDAAVSAGAERFSYAESLLHVAQQSLAGAPTRRLAPAVGVSATSRPSQLRRRIGRLLGNPEEPTRWSHSWPIALVLVAGIVIATCLLATVKAEPGASTSQTTTQPATQPTDPAIAPISQSDWGPAEQGVQIRLRARQTVWPQGQLPRFLVDMRNEGLAKRYSLQNTSWDLQVDGQWYRSFILFLNLPIRYELLSGQQLEGVEFAPQPNWEMQKVDLSKPGEIPDRSTAVPLVLTPGKHTVRVAFRFEPAESGEVVRAESGSMEIEVRDTATSTSAPVSQPAAQPAKAPWRVTLPSGATVELVGVSKNPSDGKDWWQPDGSPLPVAPYPKYLYTPDGKTPGKEYQVREFAVRVAGVSSSEDVGVMPSEDASAARPSWGSTTVADGKVVPELYTTLVEFPVSQQQADVQFRVAAGPWKTVANNSQPSTLIGSDGQTAVAFGEPYVKDGAVKITVSIGQGVDEDRRVVAVKKDGTEVSTWTSSENAVASIRTPAKLSQIVTTVPAGLSLKDIKEFRLQTRAFQWAQFKNVSLAPGHMTEVQPSAIQPEATTSRPATQPATQPTSQPAGANDAASQSAQTRVAIAQAVVKQAQARLAAMQERYRKNVATDAEVDQAKFEVEMALLALGLEQARARHDDAAAARIAMGQARGVLENAKRHMANVEAAFQQGAASQEELDDARGKLKLATLTIQLRQAELAGNTTQPASQPATAPTTAPATQLATQPAPAPASTPATQSSSGNVVTRVYDIRYHITCMSAMYFRTPGGSIDDSGFEGLGIGWQTTPRPVSPYDDPGAQARTEARRKEAAETIVKLIREKVEPSSWKPAGPGESALLKEQLTITQTPENQQAVANLLNQIRSENPQLDITATFVQVSPKTDAQLLQWLANQPGVPVLAGQGSTRLSAEQTQQFIHEALKSMDSSTLNTPRLNLFNRQRAYVCVVTSQNILLPLLDEPGKSEIVTYNGGTALGIKASASGDMVSMDYKAAIGELCEVGRERGKEVLWRMPGTPPKGIQRTPPKGFQPTGYQSTLSQSGASLTVADGQTALIRPFPVSTRYRVLGARRTSDAVTGKTTLAVQQDALPAAEPEEYLYILITAKIIREAQSPTTQPATRPVGKPEFRIVPNATGSLRQPVLPLSVEGTTEEFGPHALKELAEQGPGPARQRGDEFQWFPLAAEVTVSEALIGEYQGKKYILLSTREPYVMLPGEGETAWGLTKVRADVDNMGKPAVAFELDSRGASRLSALTKANISNTMAMLVDGQVVFAPVIRAQISGSGIIEGQYTQQRVQQIVQALATGMPASAPASAPTTQPATGPTTGRP